MDFKLSNSTVRKMKGIDLKEKNEGWMCFWMWGCFDIVASAFLFGTDNFISASDLLLSVVAIVLCLILR